MPFPHNSIIYQVHEMSFYLALASEAVCTGERPKAGMTIEGEPPARLLVKSACEVDKCSIFWNEH